MKSILHLKEDTEYQIPLREDGIEKYVQKDLKKWKKEHPDATEQEISDKEKELNYQMRKSAGQSEEEIERREKARAIRNDMEKDNKEIDRAKAGVTSATQAHKDATAKVSQAVQKKKETEADVEAQQNLETAKEDAKQAKAAVVQSQDELHDAQKSKNDKIDQLKADSVSAKETKKKADEISQEEVDQAEQDATEGLEEDPEETQNQEQQTSEENNNNETTTENIPQVDSAKAALDEMKKLASQEGIVHPSLFISNFSKILGLMERAMQLQVKESGSVTEEKAPETEQSKQTEAPTEDK